MGKKKHEQLKLEFEQYIKMNNLSSGDQLPSEFSLMDHFQVSRAAIRQVTQNLVDEQVLSRRRGVGTFVSQAKVNDSISAKWGLKREFNRLGYELITKKCSVEKVDVKLDQQQTADTYLIKRVRLIDDIPYVISHCYIATVIDLTEYHEQIADSLYELLDSKQVIIDSFQDEISICNASFEIHEALGMPNEAKLLKKKREAYSSQGTRIEYSNSYFNPEYYKFKINISNEGTIKWDMT